MTRLIRNAVLWRMEDAARRTRQELARGTASLGAVVALTPLLGAFWMTLAVAGSFGFSGEKNAAYMAMIYSLGYALEPFTLGLAIALPAYWLQRNLARQLDDLSQEMDLAASELISHLDGVVST